MIDSNTKALAIARLKMQDVPEDIAEDLELPIPLVREWLRNLSPKDTIAMEANIIAVKKIMDGELMPLENDKLKTALETAALTIAKEIEKAAPVGDTMHSKSLQLLSDAAIKLYATMILKDNNELPPGTAPSNSGFSAFAQLMKD